MGGEGIARVKRARLLRSGHDRLGLKVKDESDKWTPPGRDPAARGRPVSGCCEGGRADAGRAGAWAEAGHWAAQRRKGEGSRQAAGGEREMGRARDREGERKFFSIF